LCKVGNPLECKMYLWGLVAHSHHSFGNFRSTKLHLGYILVVLLALKHPCITSAMHQVIILEDMLGIHNLA
jgi:hypothetical protein